MNTMCKKKNMEEKPHRKCPFGRHTKPTEVGYEDGKKTDLTQDRVQRRTAEP
jgi:hypothetical protein